MSNVAHPGKQRPRPGRNGWRNPRIVAWYIEQKRRAAEHEAVAACARPFDPTDEDQQASRFARALGLERVGRGETVAEFMARVHQTLEWERGRLLHPPPAEAAPPMPQSIRRVVRRAPRAARRARRATRLAAVASAGSGADGPPPSDPPYERTSHVGGAS